MAPIPILLCGRSPEVAHKIKQDLLPEYEVVHTLLASSLDPSSLPALLTGPNAPRAILLGGAFTDDQVSAMQAAAQPAPPVVWLRVDKSRVGEMPPMGDAEAFGAALAVRIKGRLGELGVGKEGGAAEGEFLF